MSNHNPALTHDPRCQAKLVCFDLGKVLVRNCSDWEQAWRLTGLQRPAGSFDAATEERVHALVRQAEVGRLDPEPLCAGIAQIVGISAADVAAIMRAWMIGCFPGVARLIDRLHDTGMATACLSNTHEMHWRVLDEPEFLAGVPIARMTYRFASHQMGLRKPSAEIYREVERLSGLRGPQIIFFDDLEENIVAARQRDWVAIRIDDRHDPVGEATRHLVRLGRLH